MITELARRILVHADSLGEYATAISGLTAFRQHAPSACYLAFVEPSLMIFVQGGKRIKLGGSEFLCDQSSFLLACIDVPIQSQIVEASEERPQLSMRLGLDMATVREVLSREDIPQSKVPAEKRGLALGQMTAGLLDASIRLINLLDSPGDVPFLGHLIEREIIYRILQTPQGVRLRADASVYTVEYLLQSSRI